MSLKNYVLDTCVLLHDPECLNSFEDNHIHIPFIVLEELDKFKKNNDETGRNCRQVARMLDELRLKGNLTQGIDLDNGGKLWVTNKYAGQGQPQLDMKINDNIILSTACVLKHSVFKPEVILVTNDINLRIKADTVGIKAEPFGKKRNSKGTSLFSGVVELAVDPDTFSQFKRDGWTEFSTADAEQHSIYPNQYIILEKEDTKQKTYGRYDQKRNRLVKLIDVRDGVFGITAKSDEQRFAIDALLNDDIKLVSLVGKAGTGKTLLAVAAGLSKIVDQKIYSKLLVSRPVQPMGKDIGYLPGTMEEKLSPWMQPIHDNLDFLFDLNKRHKQPSVDKRKLNKKTKETFYNDEAPESLHKTLLEDGTIQVEALTYIRGRSIPQQFMIIDEAQNLTPHEIKTIVTRAGEGTKIVLTGDTQQIDSPYLDESSNGLAYCVEHMKDTVITAHVTLTKGERSELAELGSQLL